MDLYLCFRPLINKNWLLKLIMFLTVINDFYNYDEILGVKCWNVPVLRHTHLDIRVRFHSVKVRE